MNCAGYEAENSFAFRSGAPCWANGIAPESYQTSITSGTRRANPSPPSTPSQEGQVNVIPSTNGRCGSSLVRSAPASSDSSAREPTQVTCDCAHTHSGSGVPQYRVRDSAQSTLLRSHSP